MKDTTFKYHHLFRFESGLKKYASFSILSIFFTLIVLLLPTTVFTQNFFKVLNNSDQYYNQKIDHFENGDVLICDSSLEALSTGDETGEIILYRMDKCGNEIWSKNYAYDDGYLEFKDFVISENDEIFIYGSHYKGLQEFIFISKFDGISGANLGFRLFNPGTVDHFSYSIDIRNGQIMTYGLLFDFNTLKLGFIGVFDEGLNFQWAKKFEPFQSNGNAIITSDNNFLGWSGEYIIMLDSNGNPEWGKTLNQSEGLRINSGPVEINGDYLFEIHREGQSMLFKINTLGQVIWQSDLFEATDGGLALTLESPGNYICSYNAPNDEGSEVCQFLLTNDNIEDQKRLILDERINTGTIYQIMENRKLTIVGNNNSTAINPVDIKDFIFQFDLDNPLDDCFGWESFDEIFPNYYNIEFTDHSIEPEAFEMVEEARITLDALNFEMPLEDLCNPLSGPDFIQKDTLLDCGQSWIIELPGADFFWLDNNSNASRTLNEPGTYQARKQDCNNPVVIDYTLDILDCPCEISLPNIFSPNNDGFNDQLELFTDCQLDNIEVSVFNRWGVQVFKGTSIDRFWDGRFKGQDLPVGVYIVLIEYRWTDTSGPRQQMLTQDVTLMR